VFTAIVVAYLFHRRVESSRVIIARGQRRRERERERDKSECESE